MTKLSIMSLTNFINKELDTRVWGVWKACPDTCLERFLIVLKAMKNTELYNELVNDNYFISENDYICGLVDPDIECMRVILHTKNTDIVNELITMKFLYISHYESYPNTKIVRSYIPDRNVVKRMHKIEQDVLNLKKEMNDEIEWQTTWKESKVYNNIPKPPIVTKTELSSSPVPEISSLASFYNKWVNYWGETKKKEENNKTKIGQLEEFNSSDMLA